MTMLDRMRRHRGWLKWLLGIVAVSMAAFFVPWHNRQPQFSDAVARVDGTPITTGEFRRLLNQRLQMFQQQGGGSLPPETLRQLGFDRQILQQLVDQRAVEAEANRRGITVTDTEVREAIRHMPGFQENGQFVGYDRYRAVLRAQRPPYREEDFEGLVRSELLAEKLQDAVTSWITVSEGETDAEYRKRNEKVKLDVVSFQADQFRAGVTATDAEAQARFTKDPSHYKFGERRKVRYLLVDTQGLRAAVTPTPQQVEAFYNDNQQQFSNPEQVHALHILLKTTGKDEAAVRKQADAVLKDARGGADFAALARKYSEDEGSKGSGGDLNFFGRGSMVKPFEDAVFAAKAGDIVGPVQTDFGYHVIKVTGVTSPHVQSFDDVKASIEQDLKRQKASQLLASDAEKFQNLVYEQADSLEPVAKALGLKVETTQLLTRPQIQAIGLGNPKFVQALLSPESIQTKRNTEALEIAPNVLIAGRIVEYKPATPRRFDQVAGDIRKLLGRKAASELAQNAGAEKLALLQSGKADNSVGLTFAKPVSVSRNKPAAGFSSEALTRVFQADAAKLPTYVSAIDDGGGYSIYKVLKVTDAPTTDTGRVTVAGNRVGAEIGRELMNAYLGSLKAGADVKINQAALEKKER
jgi:peptidyl-prolyl cis-trans isomerase D